MQALIGLLHTLEANYKLTDQKLQTAEGDEKAKLEEVKTANKQIAEAMFKDQPIEKIVDEVQSLFGDFEEKFNAWKEASTSKRRMGARRAGDDKIEQINGFKAKVEEMNAALGGGGESKRRSLAKSKRRAAKPARKSLKAFARSLKGQSKRALKGIT